MPLLKPSLGRYFVKWLDARYFRCVTALQCYSTHCFLTETRFMELMTMEPRSIGYVATTLKGPVAFVLFRPHPEDNMTHFIDLVVHPDHRRKGLGRLLVDRMKVKSANSKCILAKTSEQNTLAHVFLKENEFVAYHVTPDVGEREAEYCFIYSKDKEVMREAKSR